MTIYVVTLRRNKMAIYKVQVKEIHRYLVEIEALSVSSAEEKVEEGLVSGDLVANSVVDIERECTAIEK